MSYCEKCLKHDTITLPESGFCENTNKCKGDKITSDVGNRYCKKCSKAKNICEHCGSKLKNNFIKYHWNMTLDYFDLKKEKNSYPSPFYILFIIITYISIFLVPKQYAWILVAPAVICNLALVIYACSRNNNK